MALVNDSVTGSIVFVSAFPLERGHHQREPGLVTSSPIDDLRRQPALSGEPALPEPVSAPVSKNRVLTS